MDRDWIAYLAGFFDGEGCVGIYQRGRRAAWLLVQITQNDGPIARSLLEQVRSEWGGRLSEQSTSSGRVKLGYAVTGNRAADMMEALSPYLRLKADQARVAVAWQRSRLPQQRNERGRVTLKSEAECLTDERCARLVRLLKHQDIDRVMADQADLVEVEHTLHQVLNYKGT